MKSFFILLLLMSATAGCYAQSADTSKKSSTREFYLTKSKNQKKTAWILLGGGQALAFAGLMMSLSSFKEMFDSPSKSNSKLDAGGVFGIIGLAADIASIPLFISASKNKRMAKRLSIENQSWLKNGNFLLSHRVIPSLTLKIGLR